MRTPFPAALIALGLFACASDQTRALQCDAARACPSGQVCEGGLCSAVTCAMSNGGCDVHARCTGMGSAITCTCDTGYTGSGLVCTPIDSCSTGNGGCGANATCTGTGPDTNTCACDSGYFGDGHTCTLTDSCATNNGGCDVNATCASTGNGTNSCTCNAGYTGDGHTCVGECTGLQSGLLVHYTFDTDFSDSSGNSRTGIATDVSIVTGGVLGGAASFASADSAVQVGDMSSYSLAGARTLCEWVNPQPATGEGLPAFTGGPAGAGDFFGLEASSPTGTCASIGPGTLYVDHWATACNDTSVAAGASGWSYVCWASDGNGTLTYFANGATATNPGDLYDYALASVYVGGNVIVGTTTQPAFSGLIDDAAIWSRTLSVAEMTEAWGNGVGCHF